MLSRFSNTRRIDAIEADVAACRDELRSVGERIDGATADIRSIRGDVEALREGLDERSGRIDALRERSDDDADRRSALDGRIAEIEERLGSSEEADARHAMEEEAIEGLRIALARLERQLDLHRDDVARTTTGLLERIEDLRRQR